MSKKVLSIFVLGIVLLSGCSVVVPLSQEASVAEEPTQGAIAEEEPTTEASVKQTSIQSPGTESSWENEVSQEPFEWSAPVVENDEYIFYSSDNKIKRVDKATGVIATIVEREKEEESREIKLYLTDKLIYFTDNSSLYTVDFSGKNEREIVTHEWLSDTFDDTYDIWDIMINDGKVYLWVAGMDIIQYDPVKKTLKKIADFAGSYCILDDTLYYVRHRGDEGLLKVDLKTSKETIARPYIPLTEKGDEDDEEYDRYGEVFVYENEMYYTYREGIDLFQVKRLCENGNDEVIFEFSYGLGEIAYGEDGIYYADGDSNGKVYLYKYNPVTKSTSQMLLPKNFLEAGGVVDGKLFYRSSSDEESPFYSVIDLDLK